MTTSIYTIGHSTHALPNFLTLLSRNGIAAVADVRSVPYSRWQPHFNRESIEDALRGVGVSYVFLGHELGGRGNGDEVRGSDGRIRYESLARSASFKAGLARVLKGSQRLPIALMCTERDPLECHRGLLVSRCLCHRGTEVVHIHADGHSELHKEAEARLLRLVGFHQADLFRSEAQLLAEAYELQESRVAHVTPVEQRTALDQ